MLILVSVSELLYQCDLVLAVLDTHSEYKSADLCPPSEGSEVRGAQMLNRVYLNTLMRIWGCLLS